MSTSLQKEISEVRNQITENAEKVKYDNLLESKAQEIQDKYDTVTDLELYFFFYLLASCGLFCAYIERRINMSALLTITRVELQR